MRPDKRLLAIVVAIVASVLVVVPPAASSPALAQTPSLTATKTAPGNILAGKNVPYTISTTNSGTAPLYNVTFRDVLPLGATYVGPSTPADFGEPEIIVNQVPDPLAVPPATIPQQTLIWSNIGDLQPGSTLALSFSVALNRTADPARPSLPVYQVGSTVRNSAESYASPNERVLPAFDAQGVPIDNPAVTTASTGPTTTRLTAIEIRKSEPSPEGELLRGVHDHDTVYTLDVETTGLAGVAAGAVVTDYLPAQLEFLGCGGVDNSTVAGGGLPEYPGAPPLSATPTPPNCRFPNTVETVVNPPADGSTVYPPGVYTKLTWILTGADTQAGTTIRLPYAAGIPLRANVPFPAGTPTTGVQASNLDNNTGASTRELPDRTGHHQRREGVRHVPGHAGAGWQHRRGRRRPSHPDDRGRAHPQVDPSAGPERVPHRGPGDLRHHRRRQRVRQRVRRRADRHGPERSVPAQQRRLHLDGHGQLRDRARSG